MKIPKLVILLLVVGLLLRLYHPASWFQYSHDQDLLGWIIRDVVENHHLRLIGQQTSQMGVFIGPLFYYSVIPWYLLFNWNPIGGVYWVAILGTFGIWSCWFVYRKILNNFAGISAAVIYAFSYSIILTDREVVPTMPVVIWSVWFLYALFLLLNGKQKTGWILSGLLIGLIWHLNMGLVLLVPLVPLAFALSRKRINGKQILPGVVIAFLLVTPYILFEIRHGFIQTQAILFSGTESAAAVGGVASHFERVVQLLSKNIYRIFLTDLVNIPPIYSLYLVLFGLGYITYKRLISKQLSALLWLWVLLYILFFSTNSIILSEYYLNGMTAIWILVVSALAKQFRVIAAILLGLFILLNLTRFSRHTVNASGYIERTAIIGEIKSDAEKHDYPCVAISYITSPGNELGYRYIIWLSELKTKPVDLDTPVYTIVFPHSLVDKIDKSFGALGLIYPDYQRYNNDRVNKSCSGMNSNLTDPLFGYTN